jgi:hypothetical protein
LKCKHLNVRIEMTSLLNKNQLQLFLTKENYFINKNRAYY